MCPGRNPDVLYGIIYAAVFAVFAAVLMSAVLSDGSDAAVGDTFIVSDGDTEFEYTVISVPGVENAVSVINAPNVKTLTAPIDVSIPSNVTNLGVKYDVYGIDHDVFRKCKIRSISIPSIRVIGEHAFENCTDLINVTNCSLLTSIGNYCFYGCSISELVLPSIEYIGNSAFQFCNSLVRVNLSSSLIEIGIDAFDCSSLGSIYVNPECVRYRSVDDSLYDLKFDGNNTRLLIVSKNVKKLKLPSYVSSIDTRAFDYCILLEEITVEPGSPYYAKDGILYSGTSIIQVPSNLKKLSVYIPDKVTVIPEFAFSNKTQLKTIHFPNNLRIIKKNAFDGCSSLENLYFGNRLQKIEVNAFLNCDLKHISFTSNPIIENGNFIFYTKDGSATIDSGSLNLKNRDFEDSHGNLILCSKITYVLDGGISSENESATSYGTEYVLNDAKDKVRIFDHWYVLENGVQVPISIIPDTNTEDLTIYAQWLKCQLSFFNNDELIESSAVYSNTSITPPVLESRIGFDLIWNSEKNGNGYNLDSTTKMPAEDSIFYAIYVPISYVLNLNDNYQDKNTSFTLKYTESLDLATITFDKLGYHICKWNTSPEGNGSTYTGVVSKLCQKNNQIITLYAIWEPNTFTVWYSPGSNGTDEINVPVVYDNAYTLQNNPYSKTGYTFSGWYSEGVRYDEGQDITNIISSGTVTFTAGWDPNQYTVEFSPGTGAGVMPPRTVHYDQDLTLPVNVFTKEGYHFKQWNHAGGPTPDKGTVRNLAESGTATLTAEWEPNTFTVRYSPGSGTGEETNVPVVYDTPYVLENNPYSKTGYTFSGWYSEGVRYDEGQEITNIVSSGIVTFTAGWDPNQYTVEFSPGTGNGIMSTETVHYDQDLVLSENQFTKEGYHFKQWNHAGGPTPDKGTVRNLAESGTVTLTAEWEPNTFTVRYSPGTGLGEETNVPVVYDTPYVLQNNPYSKTGYTFSGWYCGDLRYDEGQDITNIISSGTVTFTAGWDPNQYTVEFSPGTGNGIMSSQAVHYDQDLVLPENQFTKEGYHFKQWGHTGGPTPDKGTVRNLAESGTVTLTAEWEPNTFTVRYSPGTGSGEESNVSVVYDTSYVLESNPYSKVGYTFSGWYSGDVRYDESQDISNIVSSGIVTFTAGWNANQYAVEFSPGTGTGVMSPRTVHYDQDLVLPENQFTKEGYHFKQWTYAGGSAADKGTVRNLAESGTVTLTAEWEPNTFTVRYTPGSGTGDESNVSVVYDVPHVLQNNPYSKTGYTFSGWYSGAVRYDEGQDITNIVSSGIVTFTAGWSANQYTVEFSSGTGTGVMSPRTVHYDQDLTLPENQFTKDGYSFKQWKYTGGSAADKGTVRNLAESGTVTLTAEWEPNTFNVRYSPGSGTGGEINVPVVYDTPYVLKNNSYSKTGYTFTGWYSGDTGYSEGQDITNIICSGTVTFTAGWAANQYTVEFSSGTGTGAMEPIPVHYDEDLTLPENKFTKEGYSFKQWNHAGGPTPDKGTVRNLAESGTVTLTAEWAPNTFTVRYSPGTGSGEESNVSVIYDTPCVLQSNPYSKTGYTFSGWYSGDVRYEEGQDITNIVSSGAVTFTAGWTANQYTVEFSPGPGVGSMDPISVHYDEDLILPENRFVREGYSFKQWNHTGGPTPDKGTVRNLEESGTIVLTAEWTPNIFTVRYSPGTGSGEEANASVVYDTSYVLESNPYSKVGYTFSGWYSEGVRFDEGQDITNIVSSGTVTFTAGWAANQYNVGFSPGTGIGAMVPIPVHYDEDLILPENRFTKEGYSFKQWVYAGGTAPDKGTVRNLAESGTVTLTADWTPNTYTVHYSPGSGIGKESDVPVVYDTTYVLQNNPYSKTGYTFTGWYSEHTLYDEGQDITNMISSGTVTFTAGWAANQYTVEFSPGTGIGAMDPVPVHYDEDLILPENLFTKDGYSFEQWNHIGGPTPDKGTVRNLAESGTVTLTADWTPNKYTVHYSPGAGDGTESDVQAVYDVPYALESNPYSKTGYTFSGWFKDGVRFEEGQDITNIISSGTVTFTAGWTANQYFVEFSPGSGVGAMDPIPVHYDEDFILPENQFTKEGYSFKQWNHAGGSAPDKGTVRNLAESGTVTLTAEWEPNTFTIRYSPGAGTGGEADVPVVYDTMYALESNPYSRTGYTFSGWFKDGVRFEEGQDITNIISSGTVTFTAGWAANEYTVMFSPGTGTGTMEPIPVHYDEDIILPKNQFTKEGYLFKQWNHAVGPTPDKGTVRNLAESGTVTLTAEWMPDTYIVRYTPGTGTGEESSVHVTYDSPCSLIVNPYSKTGYTFSGWYSEGVRYEEGQDITNIVSSGTVTFTAGWTANQYTVRLSPGEGIGTMASQTSEYDQDLLLPENTFIRKGYSFLHWTYSGGTVPDKGTVRNLAESGTVTLTAEWTPNPFIVRYSPGYNGGEEYNVPAVYDSPCVLMENPYSRTGHSFSGWRCGDEIFGEGRDITNIIGSGTVTFTAQWTANEYTLMFSPGTGSGSMLPQTAEYDRDFVLPENMFFKEGYSFEQWRHTGGTVPDNGTVRNLAESGTVTLTAEWTPNIFTVRYTPGTGTGEERNLSAVYDMPCSLIGNPYSNKGHTFAGWSSGGEVYTEGQDITNIISSGTVTFTAEWTANVYTVELSPGGGDGDPVLLDARYGEDLVLPGIPFVRTGHSFVHWEYDGGTVPDKGTVRNLAESGTVTLTAVWKPVLITYRYSSGTDEGAVLQDSADYGARYCLKQNPFSKKGHTFAGWSSESIHYGAGDDITGLFDSGPVTFTAIWAPNTYTIEFSPGTGTGAMDPIAVLYGKNLILPECTFSKEGHEFTEWTYPGGSYPGKGMVRNLAESGTVTLTAEWKPKTVTVRYVSGTGTGEVWNVRSDYGEPCLLMDNPFSKTGYTFSGWSLRGGTYAEGQDVSFLVVDEDLTFTAAWAPNTYTIEFSPGTGIGAMDPIPVHYDEDLPLPENGFIKEGHSFGHWDHARGPTPDKGTVRNLAESGTVTLTAVWKPNPYTVMFMPNGAEGESYGQELVYGVPSELTSCGFVRTGHSFSGWALSADGEPVYSDRAEAVSLTAGRSVNLYAVWYAEGYRLSFETGGPEHPEDMVLEYGAPVELPPEPSMKGHGFVRWLPEVPETMPAEDIVLTAEWEPNAITVRYHGPQRQVLDEETRYGSEYRIAGCAFGMPGHSFAGWNTMQDGSGTGYLSDQIVTGICEGGVADLYAQWSVNTYTLSFDSGAGEIRQAYGSRVQTPGNPSAPGRLFCGWDVPVPETMPDADMELHAVWRPVQYDLVLHPVIGSPLTATMRLSCGQDFIVPEPEGLCEWQRFLGWSRTAGGDVMCVPGDVLSDLCMHEGDVFELHPVVEDVVYMLVFSDPDGSVLGTVEGEYMHPIDPGDVPTDGGEPIRWNADVPDSMPAHDMVLTAVQEDGGDADYLPLMAIAAAAVCVLLLVHVLRRRA